MARRWDLPGVRLYCRAVAPEFGHSDFAVLYRAARAALPDLYWFLGAAEQAFLLPPGWGAWPGGPGPFDEMAGGLARVPRAVRKESREHAASDQPNALDRCAGYVRDDWNEFYGFEEKRDWREVSELYETHRTHPRLLAEAAVLFRNPDAAFWGCYSRDTAILDAAEHTLRVTPGARVERGRLSERGFTPQQLEELDRLEAPGR